MLSPSLFATLLYWTYTSRRSGMYSSSKVDRGVVAQPEGSGVGVESRISTQPLSGHQLTIGVRWHHRGGPLRAESYRLDRRPPRSITIGTRSIHR